MLEIFQFDFMVRAFAAGLAIAVVAPVIGMFLVVRRYSLMADTLAHVSLAGVAIGLLLGLNPVITAIIASIIASIGIERLRTTKRMLGESVLALFLSGSLAIAVILLSLAKGFNMNLFSYLFGSISVVSPLDLYLTLGLAVLLILVVKFLYKEFFFLSFDTDLARASGVRTKTLALILTALAAVTVSLSIRVVGVLLIGALMVIPVISAMQFGRGFRNTMLISIVFSVISVISGLFLSFYWNIASGGAIVVVALVIFLLSLLLNTNRS
ncbi:MAG: metal ABC transporter permease [Candidatus Yonathbacteria bacterium]|nr:metal ABC transporter permease [Candidatus Yonathbacteria bacterium]